MQLRGRKLATAAAAAVIGTLLGGSVVAGPPGAFAAPSAPTVPVPDPVGGPAPGAPAGAAAGAPSGPLLDPGAVAPRTAAEGPAVWPRPQSMAADAAREVPLGEQAVLVAAPDADPYAVEVVRTALRAAGVRILHELPAGAPLPERGTVVRLQGPGAEEALRALGATAALFHGAQTLRQLLAAGGAKVPGVLVRDWPAAPVRGITEGFYGQPWTQEQRLAQLDFMGRTKQNRLLLAPGNDPYRTTEWRAEYPREQQEEFRALAERARANRVVLGWAVAPGQSMCLASAADRAALARKLDAMWELGFRAFQVQFQDVSYTEWGCRADRVRYGNCLLYTSGRGPAVAAADRVPPERRDRLPHGAGRPAGPPGGGGLDGRGRRTAHHHREGTDRGPRRLRPAPARHHGQLPGQRLGPGPDLPRPVHGPRTGGRRRLGRPAGQCHAAGGAVADPAVHGG